MPERRSLHRAVAVSALVQGVGGGLGWSSSAAALPLLRSEGRLTFLESVQVWAAGGLGIALASFLGGLVVERYGARRAGAGGLLLGAFACAARAAIDAPFALAALSFLFGLQIGFVAPAVSRALAAEVDPAALGKANRQVFVAYGVGTLACFLAAPLVGDGWRGAMVVVGAAMTVVADVWHRTIPEAAPGEFVRVDWEDVRTLARNRGLRLVTQIQFLLFGSYLAMLVVLPPLLAARQASGWLFTAWLAVAVGANVLGARWSDRVGLRRPFVRGGALLAGLAFLGLAFGGPSELLLLAAIGGGLMAPLVSTLPLELPYAGAPGLAVTLGMVLVGGQVGGVALPMLSALTLEHAGVEATLALLAAAHLLILIPARRLAETGPGASIPAALVDFGGAAA